jgi:hypothetical protein
MPCWDHMSWGSGCASGRGGAARGTWGCVLTAMSQCRPSQHSNLLAAADVSHQQSSIRHCPAASSDSTHLSASWACLGTMYGICMGMSACRHAFLQTLPPPVRTRSLGTAHRVTLLLIARDPCRSFSLDYLITWGARWGPGLASHQVGLADICATASRFCCTTLFCLPAWCSSRESLLHQPALLACHHTACHDIAASW